MSDTHSDDLFVFAMGEFDATFPTDRLYAKNHMWAKSLTPADEREGDLQGDRQGDRQRDRQRVRFGLSAYAVRLLQDVYFLEWEMDPPAEMTRRQMIGAIESKKAESDLFAPLGGEFAAVNEAVLNDPSLINADPYGKGWMIEMRVSREESEHLLDPAQYEDHLTEAWEVAQRTIKGQANL